MGRQSSERNRAALIVAHPGHELAILGWLERARPAVFVITDGSGRDGVSRIASTAEILRRTGAEPGPIFGRFAEREVYAALLAGDAALFVALAEELAGHLVEGDFDIVVGEAAEGFQPTHDVCRMVVDAACELARRDLGRPLEGYEFVLFSRQAKCPVEDRDGAIWIELDDAALAKKLGLASQYRELAAEYHAAVSGDLSAVLDRFPQLAALAAQRVGELGPEAYRIECLQPIPPGLRSSAPAETPFFELYGEALQGAGQVRQVIRFEEHLAPIAAALARRLAVATASRGNDAAGGPSGRPLGAG